MTNFTHDEFFQIFGEISVQFATLDFFVTALLCNLCISTLAPKLRERATLGQKVTYLGSLSPKEVVDPGVLHQLSSVLASLRNVADVRNRYTHDLWMMAQEDVRAGSLRRLSIQIAPTFDIRLSNEEPTTIHEMRALIDNIQALQRQVGEVVFDLGSRFPDQATIHMGPQN